MQRVEISSQKHPSSGEILLLVHHQGAQSRMGTFLVLSSARWHFCENHFNKYQDHPYMWKHEDQRLRRHHLELEYLKEVRNKFGDAVCLGRGLLRTIKST